MAAAEAIPGGWPRAMASGIVAIKKLESYLQAYMVAAGVRRVEEQASTAYMLLTIRTQYYSHLHGMYGRIMSWLYFRSTV